MAWPIEIGDSFASSILKSEKKDLRSFIFFVSNTPAHSDQKKITEILQLIFNAYNAFL